MGGVQRDFDGVSVDLSGDFEGEDLLPALPGGSFAREHGEQDLQVIAALAPVVTHDDLRWLVEPHLDLARARDEARTAGRGAQIFILVGGAGSERSGRRSGRIGLDEFDRTAGEDWRGEFDAEECAAHFCILGRGECESDFGGAGAGVLHGFGGRHGPAIALSVPKLPGSAHLHRYGFHLAVAGIAVLLLLAAGAADTRKFRLGDADAGAEFEQVALDAHAGQVSPRHDFGLGERRARRRKQNQRAGNPNHHRKF